MSVAAFLFNLWLIQAGHLYFSFKGFLLLWLGVLVLAAIGNTVILYREARRAGTTFPSPAMISAISGMAPAFLAAGVLTGVIAYFDVSLTGGISCIDINRPEIFKVSYIVVPFWMLFYGIGLLGTQHFAPRSIIVLGWAFVLSSLFTLITTPFWVGIFFMEMRTQGNLTFYLPSAIMAATFGGYHLLYATLVSRSNRHQKALTAAQP